MPNKIADPETPFVTRLRQLCGYVENASDTSVHVSQDDATGTWVVAMGPTMQRKSYHGTTMEEAFEKAFTDPANDPFSGL